MANSTNDIVNNVPALQRRPKTDREWINFVNELTKWIATMTNTLEIRQQSEAANLKFSGTQGGDTTSPISTYTTSGAVQGHVQIDVGGNKYWLPFVGDPSL